MMKAAPVTPLVVTQAQLGLELLIVPLDPPACLGMTHQFLEGEFPGQGGQPIMTGLGLCLWPFDQQPLLGARLIAMSRTHTHACKARGQRSVGSFAPADLLPT